MRSITREQVMNLLTYNPDTGEFTRKLCPEMGLAWNARWAGKKAGGLDHYGYIQIGLFGRLYKAHRLAWIITYGEWPPEDIDHYNRDKSDNRIVNLRACTRGENQQNCAPRSDGRYLGVSFCKQTKRWRAKIAVNKKQIHLGRFSSPEDARDAYLAAKAKLHTFHPTV